MLSLTFIAVFVLCFALAILYVLIGHELVNTFRSPFLRNYFYYLLAFLVFAIYSFWGHIGMQALISAMEAKIEIIQATAVIMPLIGFPFFIIAMLMVIRMAYDLVNRSLGKRVYILHLGVYLATGLVVLGIYIVQGSWSFIAVQSATIILVLGMECLYFLLFTIIILRYLKNHTKAIRTSIINFTLLILLGLLLRLGLLALNEVHLWIQPLLLLLCFLSPIPGLWYIKLKSDLMFDPIAAENPEINNKVNFFEKYGITKREREVIEQICLGKTNQQIADTLFISLQTVKDHTHRIYTKVGINNRMQLVRLITA